MQDYRLEPDALQEPGDRLSRGFVVSMYDEHLVCPSAGDRCATCLRYPDRDWYQLKAIVYRLETMDLLSNFIFVVPNFLRRRFFVPTYRNHSPKGVFLRKFVRSEQAIQHLSVVRAPAPELIFRGIKLLHVRNLTSEELFTKRHALADLLRSLLARDLKLRIRSGPLRRRLLSHCGSLLVACCRLRCRSLTSLERARFSREILYS